jgi:hypothetical protein
LDTGHLGTSVVGGGAVTMTGSSMVLSTATNADSAICYFRNPLSKTEASSYSVKFRFSNLSDLTSIGLLDLHSGDAPPTAVAAGYLSACLVRSGVTHGLQLKRVGTDGVTRYYNFANATWGTSPTRFSLQPSVTYVLKLEVNNSGQFRYVVCNQAGTPQVNGMTLWASFSHGDE